MEEKGSSIKLFEKCNCPLTALLSWSAFCSHNNFPAVILLILWSWIESSIFSINLREYFKDITDPALADFYISGVINFVGGVDQKIMDHVNFMSAVNYYESTMHMNLVLKGIVIILLTLMVSGIL